MDAPNAITAFAALAHPHRLGVFRMLMTEGPSGLTAGEIASRIGLAPSSLSFHLAQLDRAGLLRSWRVQRHVHYAVDVEGARELIRFLTQDCCGGHPELCGYDATAPACEEQTACIPTLEPRR